VSTRDAGADEIRLPKEDQAMKDTQAYMRDEILSSLSYSTLEDIEDRSGELIDSYLPVYNNRIIEEWQHMPIEYDNRGASELGYEGDPDIVRLMTLDLYLYYSDLFSEVMEEIKREQELELEDQR
jgi:hypothetical protein